MKKKLQAAFSVTILLIICLAKVTFEHLMQFIECQQIKRAPEPNESTLVRRNLGMMNCVKVPFEHLIHVSK